MDQPLPDVLSRLLEASDEAARDRAWAKFADRYSKLLLKTARRLAPSHDGAMDRYTFVLEKLREDDFRRLRGFSAGSRGRFTTWLVVVARRLCVDYHRHRHGRPQRGAEGSAADEARQTARRNLLALIGDELQLHQVADETALAPDTQLVAAERRDALQAAISGLDPADQLLLTLRFDDGLPVARIAPLVGLESRFQVHRRLKSLLAHLRKELEARGVVGP